MQIRLSCVLGLALAAGLASQSPVYTGFGLGCRGSMPPAQFAVAVPPVPGAALLLGINNLPNNAAFMVTGFSNSASPFGLLPLELSLYGMPRCYGLVRPDDTRSLVGSGNRATYALAIPANAGLAGLRFYQQALVLDANAGNPAGAVMSDAFVAWIGTVGSFPVPAMVLIMPGSFQMGSTQGSPEELPVHTVNITQPFLMGQSEVTQAEYQAVTRTNPSFFKGTNYPNNASRPVETVSWYDAMSYCAALTAQEALAGRLQPGYQYRLPTEAEWEYCCRAGTTTQWNTGTSLNCGLANFYNENTPSYCVPDPRLGSGQTSVVGSYPANNWGLHDMHGNVNEWCLDAWDGRANYPVGPVSDPFVSGGQWRVVRGGGWNDPSTNCRSANRRGGGAAMPPGGSRRDAGFRIVLAPILVP